MTATDLRAEERAGFEKERAHAVRELTRVLCAHDLYEDDEAALEALAIVDRVIELDAILAR